MGSIKSYQIRCAYPGNLTVGDYEQSDGCANAKGERGNILQKFYAWSDKAVYPSIPPVPSPLQKTPVPLSFPGDSRSRCSSSVNSGTSTAVTVIVVVARFSSSARSSGNVLLLDAAEVAFLREDGGLVIIPPSSQTVLEDRVVA